MCGAVRTSKANSPFRPSVSLAEVAAPKVDCRTEVDIHPPRLRYRTTTAKPRILAAADQHFVDVILTISYTRIMLETAQTAPPEIAADTRSGVEVTGLSLSFNTPGHTISVLENLNFVAQPGEYLGIVGPSGCGKTTLLRLIADLFRGEPASISGSIRVRGTTPQTARKQRQLGFLFQTPTLLPWRNVLDNVLISADVRHQRTQSAVKKALELLSLFQLDEFTSSPIWHLSGGMQQRVALARAFYLQPKILLLDEPFTGLDDLARDELINYLQRTVSALGATTLFVSHDIGDIITVCDRVLVLSPRPATILDQLAVDLPRPRTPEVRYTDAYVRTRAHIDKILRASK